MSHLPSSRLLGEERENAGPGADIQHDLPVEVDRVVEDGFLVGGGPDEVLHHVLLLAQISVELEILAGAALLGPLAGMVQDVTLQVQEIRE